MADKPTRRGSLSLLGVAPVAAPTALQAAVEGMKAAPVAEAALPVTVSCVGTLGLRIVASCAYPAIGPEPYRSMTPSEYNDYLRKALEGNG